METKKVQNNKTPSADSGPFAGAREYFIGDTRFAYDDVGFLPSSPPASYIFKTGKKKKQRAEKRGKSHLRQFIIQLYYYTVARRTRENLDVRSTGYNMATNRPDRNRRFHPGRRLRTDESGGGVIWDLRRRRSSEQMRPTLRKKS